MIKIPYSKDLILPAEAAGTMSHFLWEKNGYTPRAEFRLVYNEDALRVQLSCDVEQVTVYALEDNGNVWEDNCMEFFFQPFPADPEYINFECNAIGCMVIGKGIDRNNRTCVLNRIKPQMEVSTAIRPGKGWEVSYMIPFRAIEEIYGKPYAPKKGDTFRFNAYICGERTPLMHFGACFDLPIAQPDFHRSEYFGEGLLD
ncbi:MAG: carbohydrate-binding family 9-like protein [Clostridia bacterium]|nr:carbohydrate-binding family 9-like protein [Clostridia bacterium]